MPFQIQIINTQKLWEKENSAIKMYNNWNKNFAKVVQQQILIDWKKESEILKIDKNKADRERKYWRQVTRPTKKCRVSSPPT